MYFATRSVRLADPVLICPAFVATAMSAMIVSSVSPERWLMTVVYPERFASSMQSKVSVSVPIWFVSFYSSLIHPPPHSLTLPISHPPLYY